MEKNIPQKHQSGKKKKLQGSTTIRQSELQKKEIYQIQKRTQHYDERVNLPESHDNP